MHPWHTHIATSLLSGAFVSAPTSVLRTNVITAKSCSHDCLVFCFFYFFLYELCSNGTAMQVGTPPIVSKDHNFGALRAIGVKLELIVVHWTYCMVFT